MSSHLGYMTEHYAAPVDLRRPRGVSLPVMDLNGAVQSVYLLLLPRPQSVVRRGICSLYRMYAIN
jgi:hypothetical protein